jgi:opacity protein-like surface antigen
MLFRKSLTALVLGSALASLPAFSQEEAPQYRHEVSAQALGSFLKDTTENGVQHSATNSGGVLGSYRFFFNKNHGIEVDYGWTRNTLSYTGLSSLKTDSHEVTAAYVFRYPLKRVSLFALAGGGGLVFDPKYAPSLDKQARAAALYGAGADINLTQRLFFRAQYRGLIYNSPTFDQPGLNGFDRITHSAEPSAGIGFRF